MFLTTFGRSMKACILGVAMQLLAINHLLQGAEGAGLCFMLYQNADNNLEYFIRQDNYEFLQSESIESSKQNTWVYFDARNLLGTSEDITVPLQDVWNEGGTSLLTDLSNSKYQGSRYLHWENGKMVVDTTLTPEQDSDDPTVITAFLVHALKDCVSWGADQYFLTFASHGGGFAGFGGDDTKMRNRHRKLLSSNQKIVTAIQDGLSQVPGAPSKFDVLGFDACLMQAYGAMDDFRAVTDNIVASEAVEPGHGWAYANLTSASGSALDLAKDIVTHFVEEKQGYETHQTPKILAVASASGYDNFLAKWEILMEEMTRLVDADNDPDFYSIIGRARSEAISFEGIADDTGTKTPSALDMGSFMTTLQSMCATSAPLGTFLSDAITAYNAMFEISMYGEGSTPGTGMHITWPFKSDYLAFTTLWDSILFDAVSYRTSASPNFIDFMRAYLQSTSPTTDTSNVCGTSFSDVTAGADEILLVNPVVEILDEAVTLQVDLLREVDHVELEYGLDFTQPLGPYLESLGFETRPDDFLLLYGGDVSGSFVDSDVSYVATWDRLFYFLTIDDGQSYEALYVKSGLNGQKSSPVLYVSEEDSSRLGTVQFLDFLFWTLEDWEVNVGAQYAFCTFSSGAERGEVDQNFLLYGVSSYDTFAEIPRERGGFIIPIVYVNAYIQGFAVSFLPGGFNQTILKWSTEINYEIISRSDLRVAEITDANAVIADVVAEDFDNPDGELGYDYVSFDIIGTSAPPPTSAPIDIAGSVNGEETSSSLSCFSLGLYRVLLTTAATSFVICLATAHLF